LTFTENFTEIVPGEGFPWDDLHKILRECREVVYGVLIDTEIGDLE